MTERVDEQTARGLLGRGGAVLALAATAHSRGRMALSEKWHVLSPQLVASAEQVLKVLEGGVNPSLLASAVRRAMNGDPVTAIPGWAEPIVDGDAIIPRLGELIDDALIAPALPPGVRVTDPGKRGLAALAVAFCRSRDTLTAMARRLPTRAGEEALAMACLAQATVTSGEPSRARGVLKRHLREMPVG